MKNMKRFLSLLLCFVLLLPFASFAGADSDELYYLPGDINNDNKVDTADARMILRMSVDLETWESIAEKCNDAARYDYRKAADPNGDGTVNTGDARQTLRAAVGIEVLPIIKQTLYVNIGTQPTTLDPALNTEVDAATLLMHLYSGIAKYAVTEDGAMKVVADCAKELPAGTVGADGKVTYEIQLKDNLKWSDGSPLTAADFVYAWNRAADPGNYATYGYMMSIIDGFAEMNAYGNDGNRLYPDAKLNVKAEGNKLTVVTTSYFPYFYDLLAFHIFMPVKQSVVEANENWAANANTYVSNGAYSMTQWVHDEVIVLTQNENYHNAASVRMHTISFNLNSSTDTLLDLYDSGKLHFTDTVPFDEDMTAYGDEFYTIGSLGTYFYAFNVNKSLLPSSSTLTGAEREKAEAEIRNALSLLIDRNYIVDALGMQNTSKAASSFVPIGLTDANGVGQFYENAGSSDDFIGYFDTSADAYESNCISALTTLAKYYNYNYSTGKFTNFPSIELSYNTSSGHYYIAQCVQYDLGLYGITVTLNEMDWADFLTARTNGDLQLSRNGWIADYNDPLNFLEMWISSSGNNDALFGNGNHADVRAYSLDLTPYGIDYKVTNGTWAQTYDYLISVIYKTIDEALRFELMHLAEDLLMSTGAVMPLYYYTDSFLCDSSVQGWYATPLGFKVFMYATIR